MSWTATQKQIAVRACKEVGIDDEMRKFLLRQFPHSKFDRDGKAAPEPSSTSKRLNQSDFEQFMALIEDKAQGKRVLNFSPEYWAKKSGDDLSRMRRLARLISRQISEHVPTWNDAAMAGWIKKCVTRSEVDRLDDLDYEQLQTLIAQLRAFGAKQGVKFREAA